MHEKASEDTALIGEQDSNTSKTTFLALGAGQFLLGAAGVTYYAFSAIWYSEQGYTNAQIGLVGTLESIADPVFMLIASALLDKYRCQNLGLVLMTVVAGTLRFLMLRARHTGFWLVATLDVTADPFLMEAFALLEGVCAYALTHKTEFPALKCFSTVGAVFFSMVVSVAAHFTGNYDYIFVTHLLVCFVFACYWCVCSRCIAAAKTEFVQNIDYMSILRNLARNQSKKDVIVSFLCAWIGVLLGAFQLFRLLILKRLGGSSLLIGAADVVSTFGEFGVYLVASFICEYLTVIPTLCLSLGITGIRFLIYGIVSRPLEGFLGELLSGFTFALPFCAAVLHFTARVPEELKGSLMSTLVVLIAGVGWGLGGLLCGMLADKLGLQYAFLSLAAMSSCICATTLAIHACILLDDRSESETAVTKV